MDLQRQSNMYVYETNSDTENWEEDSGHDGDYLTAAAAKALFEAEKSVSKRLPRGSVILQR